MSVSSPDYTQISGFYGPGTWAAWVITLITSWIPILQNDHKHNLHYISYLLYTNWATIDLIRQVALAVRHQKGFGEVSHTQLQNINAALAVVQVGILHGAAQFALCCFLAKGQDADIINDIKRRRQYISIGLLTPWATNVCTASYFNRIMVDHLLVFCLFTACTLAGIVVLVSNIFLLMEGLWNPEGAGSPLTGPLFAGVVLVISVLPMIDFATKLSPSTSRDYMMRNRCAFVPCARQAIFDWDQAFSLLVALFVFFYEYGTSLILIARKAVEDAAGWLVSFLVQETGVFSLSF